MASKKSTNKKSKKKKSTSKTSTKSKKSSKKTHTTKKKNNVPSIKPKETVAPQVISLAREREMAMDFATKVYKEFDTLIKSVVLFGSAAKHEANERSDVDIIIILDDVSVKFDNELIAWYRTHLGKLIEKNKYLKPLHVNSVKLSTWWQDLMRGDPIVVNVLRYGDALIDFGGFFNPLKILLKEGKIHSTPEAIYTLLERAPTHLARARKATLAAVDGLYWCMVDSAHAVLIAADIMPPSPEKIGPILHENFVKTGILHRKYIKYYEELHTVAKDIVHGKRTEVSGQSFDEWFTQADDFLREMAKLIEDLVKEKR